MRDRKLQRLRDERDDLQCRLDRWGFGMYPSEKRMLRERIAKLDTKIAAASPGEES